MLKPCGTPAAYARHKKHGEEPCDACREAYRTYSREYHREYARRWRAANPGYDRRRGRYSSENWRRWKHGLTQEEYEKMFEIQNGCCAICQREVDLHVDHDHDSGEIRGLLCSFCNRGIGMFKDEEERLIQAAKYLGWQC